jgi:glycine cleavage system H lipoate-binding protein
MSDEHKDQAAASGGHGQPVIPRGEVPCVWMTAGVLNFRLCDRDLECSACPLDRAIRNTPEPMDAPEAPEPTRATASGCVLPRSLFIHGSHLWVRLRAGGEMEVGIDDLARRLIGRARGFRLPVEGEELTEGLPAFEAVTGIGSVGFPSPIDGVVVRANPALADRPELAHESAYEAGWIFRGVAPDPMAALAGLTRDEPAQTLLERDCRRVRDFVDIANCFEDPAVTTLPDGGRLADSPLTNLPAAVARRILAKILNCTVRFTP